MARRRGVRGVIWLLVLAAVAGGGVWGWLRWRDSDKQADTYRTELVSRGDVTMSVTATGTISAVTTVLVGSQVSGIIARIHADFNSPVRTGQLLAELDPSPFEATVAQRQADVDQAEVQLRNSQLAFRRQTSLLALDLTPQSDYDDAKAAVDAAQTRVEQSRAALDQAKTNLTYTRILSPIDGVVVERQYDVGQTVAASFQAPTLFTIAEDLKKMQVQADVDQSDIGRIAVGQEARFTVDAYPGETFRGRITQIRLNATVNQNVVSYPVIIQVPNPDEKLRPKMTADVTIDVATVHDVLRVASASLRFRPVQSGSGEGGRAGANGGGTRASAGSPSGGGMAGETPRGSGTHAGSGSAPSGSAGLTRAAESGGAGAAGAASAEIASAAPTGERAASDGSVGAGSRSGGAGWQGRDPAHGGAPGAWKGGGHRGEGDSSRAALPAGGSAASPAAVTSPEEGATPPAAGPAAGWRAARDAVAAAAGGGTGKHSQTVYRLGSDGKPEAVEIRTGISDGRFTQVVDGALQPGERIIVGLATVKADSTQQPFGGRRPF